MSENERRLSDDTIVTEDGRTRGDVRREADALRAIDDALGVGNDHPLADEFVDEGDE